MGLDIERTNMGKRGCPGRRLDYLASGSICLDQRRQGRLQIPLLDLGVANAQ